MKKNEREILPCRLLLLQKNVIFKKSGLEQTFDTILCQGCQKATASCCNLYHQKICIGTGLRKILMK